MRAALLLAAATAVGAVPASASAAGELTSLGKPVGAEGQAASAVVSPNGRSVYVGAIGGGGALTVFSRNNRTGALKRLRGRKGCITRSGSRRRCTRDRSMKDVFEIAISPDGRSLYAGSSGFLTTYARNSRTGAVRLLGQPLRAGGSPVVSKDGRHVYAGSVAFVRNPSTGTLSPGPATTLGASVPASSSDDIALAPDGRFAYVLRSTLKDGTSLDNAFVIALSRDPATGGLAALPGGCFQAKPEIPACGPTGWAAGIAPGDLPANYFSGADLAVTPDGTSLLTAINSGGEGAEHSIGEIGAFTRDAATGALTPFPAGLQSGGLTDNFNGFALSPDGKNVYQASDMNPAIQTLAVGAGAKVTGVQCLIQQRQRPCKQLTRMEFPAGVAVSPNGRSVYVTNSVNVLAFKRR
ncbi:MAG: hypothetical protein H0V29_02540 [Thermoleophilaceae bacterium]|nr:hypothetical protein [Thermoleophilaceae bacterium]